MVRPATPYNLSTLALHVWSVHNENGAGVYLAWPTVTLKDPGGGPSIVACPQTLFRWYPPFFLGLVFDFDLPKKVGSSAWIACSSLKSCWKLIKGPPCLIYRPFQSNTGGIIKKDTYFNALFLLSPQAFTVISRGVAEDNYSAVKGFLYVAELDLLF